MIAIEIPKERLREFWDRIREIADEGRGA